MDTYEEKKTYTSCRFVPMTTGVVTQLCNHDPRRKAIVIFSSAGGGQFAPDKNLLNPAIGTDIHGNNFTSSSPGIFSRVLHGALATSAWFGFVAAGSDEACIYEVLEQ